jgi:tannase/feruloyl esterase
MTACDAIDGVVDGLLDDPRKCQFDPRVLACTQTVTAECLTKAQVDALAKIYAGPTDSVSGEHIFPGLLPGHEGTPRTWAGWMIAEPATSARQFIGASAYFGQIVHEQLTWDLRTLDFHRDVALAVTKTGGALNATSPDLRAFRAGGGKLLQYHGWGDAAISPLGSIEYYEDVKGFFETFPGASGNISRPIDDFYRLFMVPGMGHCGGVAGPAYFGNVGLGDPAAARDPQRDVFSALER